MVEPLGQEIRGTAQRIVSPEALGKGRPGCQGEEVPGGSPNHQASHKCMMGFLVFIVVFACFFVETCYLQSCVDRRKKKLNYRSRIIHKCLVFSFLHFFAFLLLFYLQLIYFLRRLHILGPLHLLDEGPVADGGRLALQRELEEIGLKRKKGVVSTVTQLAQSLISHRYSSRCHRLVGVLLPIHLVDKVLVGHLFFIIAGRV